MGTRLLQYAGRIHLTVGILTVAFFGFTGHWMDGVHDHLVGYDTTTRMLFRSVHIYILLVGIAHFFLGLNYQPATVLWRQALQGIGSLLLLAAPFYLGIAFFTEPWLEELARPYTRPALYAMFGGGLAYFAAWMIPAVRQKATA